MKKKKKLCLLSHQLDHKVQYVCVCVCACLRACLCVRVRKQVWIWCWNMYASVLWAFLVLMQSSRERERERRRDLERESVCRDGVSGEGCGAFVFHLVLTHWFQPIERTSRLGPGREWDALRPDLKPAQSEGRGKVEAWGVHTSREGHMGVIVKKRVIIFLNETIG